MRAVQNAGNQFLLTPLREGRPNKIILAAKVSTFLLTPLREGRRKMLENLPINISPISTHAPAGGATSPPAPHCTPTAISTHAPAGGATCNILPISKVVVEFLLTPLREGRPAAPRRDMSEEYVFLLTPLREGRHASQLQAAEGVSISTHAPAGGATFFHPSGLTDGFQFLLTPLREGRLRLCLCDLLLVDISTHAPAGGATQSCCGST